MNHIEHPESKGEKFKLVLESDFLQYNVPRTQQIEVQVLSEPKKIDKWWWKIIKFVTFGKYYHSYWVYDITVIRQHNNNE